MRCVCVGVVGFALLLGLIATPPLDAAQRLCNGDVCAAHITRSAKNHWELLLRLKDSALKDQIFRAPVMVLL